MNQACISRVRNHRTIETGREFRHLHPFRDTGHAGHVYLNDFDGLFLQILTKRLPRVEMLTQSDRDVQFSSQDPVRSNVLGVEWFLQPTDLKFFETLSPYHGSVEFPGLI